ncbi:DUF916 and DUF3324 domain-containing protein [Levilactobacillus tujiorum]|uniref:DUF916 and DUF3324 domain-containing protein n=1 Tax=Levilactobacillus tujiorum TaxID=2912243 RepID=A0ABX1L7F6_9LACO|nr:DUF916 and DUF3324 domain-containing protein [Levilactobacillus tujiorum]MCH5465296.1 DUF916 and DUF3324 domain-containing protein [Levilactobacillus tujiorum]NLR12287.1 DUF916 and DUF3324 domain-containing protein [Lactobacillus sp. HBUAS51387]NLR30299.1 DUF916 and DUF3324 domain-containing protein [Levilactobacillus tujiorum]
MLGLKRIRLVWLMVIGLICGGLFSLGDFAQAATNNVGYNVSAKLPSNQINKQNTFFDLKMNSGKTQTLQVKVFNVTNEEIKVKTAIHTAWTNSAGTIEYVNTTNSFDPSLRYKMSDITKIQGEKTLTIPAKGSKVVSATVDVPKTNFTGIILGGWYFQRVDDKVTGTVKGAGNLKSQYSYVIGMKYTVGHAANPAMSLGKVGAGLSNYHRGVIADIRNTSAVIIPNLKTTTTITNRDGGEVVQKAKQENVQMAPNTTYRYPMLYGKTALEAGHYHLHMVVKNTDHEWVFDRNFTITKAQADKYNKNSVDNQGLNIWLLVALGALGMLILVLLILLIIYLIRRKRRKDDEEEE